MYIMYIIHTNTLENKTENNIHENARAHNEAEMHTETTRGQNEPSH